MARIDDYRESFRLAGQQLLAANLHRLARLAEAEVVALEDGATELGLPLLGEAMVVRVRETVDVEAPGRGGELSLPEKILVCHYLLRASGDPPTGNLITFRQIPDGK